MFGMWPSELKWLSKTAEFSSIYQTIFPSSTIANLEGSTGVRGETNHELPSIGIQYKQQRCRDMMSSSHNLQEPLLLSQVHLEKGIFNGLLDN